MRSRVPLRRIGRIAKKGCKSDNNIDSDLIKIDIHITDKYVIRLK